MAPTAFLSRVQAMATAHPATVAFYNSRGEALTYEALWKGSDALAAQLLARTSSRPLATTSPAGDSKGASSKTPVIVCGHKSPLMLLCMLGALKAGLGYVPIDRSFPQERVRSVLAQVEGAQIVLTDSATPAGIDPSQVTCTKKELQALVETALAQGADSVDSSHWVSGADLFYLLFTSGSTGAPKGVAMAAHNIDAFLTYSDSFFPQGPDGKSAFGLISFCRVPYSFDLSMNDVLSGLTQGATLFGLEEEAEQNPALLFSALAKANPHLWISTPSFVELCLADASFGPRLLPRLSTMIVAGEVLRNTTAQRILERFPGLCLRNMYGPTETQSVSQLVVDEAMAASSDPLSIGYVNPATTVAIVEPKTREALPCGQKGEILIAGPTVFGGYWHRQDLTDQAFVELLDAQGVSQRYYKTGDRGHVDSHGRLFCQGRFDFQVKLNGVRIELGEIERLLCAMDGVKNAVVLPVERQSKVNHLVAHVLVSPELAAQGKAAARPLREELARALPAYMLPRFIRLHSTFPTNTNGKVDRAALAASNHSHHRTREHS